MSKHFEKYCQEHGEKRKEEYDDHYIYVCDECSAGAQYRKQFKNLLDLNDRLGVRIKTGYQSLEETRQLLKEVSERHGFHFVIHEIRRLN